MPAHKTSYPPDGVFLYYSGNEVVPACAGSVPPVPRGHRAVAKGQSGATLYAALKASTLRSGAQAVTQAAVRRLVRERGPDGRPGRVLGVEVHPRYLPAVTSDLARFADSMLQMTGLYNQEVHVAGELAATIAVSVDAAVRDLGYDPEIELDEGMRRSVAWCRSQGLDL